MLHHFLYNNQTYELEYKHPFFGGRHHEHLKMGWKMIMKCLLASSLQMTSGEVSQREEAILT